jgi:hypothetical protein
MSSCVCSEIDDNCVEKDKLHVIAVVNNPRRFKRRYELFQNFVKHMSTFKHVILYVVELAFGDRSFEIAKKNKDDLIPPERQLQLRSSSEIWHKENMINLGVQHLLPSDWNYMAWIDADLQFTNEKWDIETIHCLQHHPIVQLWMTCADLGPEGETLQLHKSFGWLHFTGKIPGEKYGEYMHSGYAWGMTKEAWNQCGGLIDFAILGAADHHQALCFIGKYEKGLPGNCSESYRRHIEAYQLRCDKFNHNIGYVPGTIVHFWHGKKKDRKYNERWEILINNNYDPTTDICKDHQGLIKLTGNKPKLGHQISKYFIQRNEDSIDTE